MPKGKIKDKEINYLDRFLDGGLRFYICRIAWDSYHLQKDMMLAGYMSESKKITEELKAMDRPENVAKSPTYNELVREANDYADNADLQTDTTWKELEDNVKSYFTTGMRVHEYTGELKSASIGYYINTDTRELTFFDGKKYVAVCHLPFPDATGADITKATFPWVFPGGMVDAVVSTVSSRSMKLTPELFIDMVHIAQEQNPRASFHLPVDKRLMHLYDLLKRKKELKDLTKNLKDSRNASQLANDLSTRINARIDSYLAIPGKAGTPKGKIMAALKVYLEDGDYAKLAAVVAANDRHWFIKLFSFTDEVDRTLNQVKRLHSSQFFTAVMSEIRSEKASSLASDSSDLDDFENSTDYEYESNIEDYGERAEVVKKYWQESRVSREAFANTLDEMERCVGAIESENSGYLTELITLPDALMEEYGYTSEEDEEEEEARSSFVKKTVTGHLRTCIEEGRAELSRTTRATDFQSDCATLQSRIDTILGYRYANSDPGTRTLLSEAEQAIYINLGEGLTDILKETQKQRPIQREELLTVVAIKNEINRLRGLHNGLKLELAEFQRRLGKIHQATFHGAIESFLQGKLKDREKELDDLLSRIEQCKDDKFNMLHPLNSNQREAVAVKDELESFGTDISDSLYGLLYTTPGDSVPREFIVVSRKHEDKHRQEYAQITEDFCELWDRMQAGAAACVQTESRHMGESSTTSMGMFASSSVSEDFDRPVGEHDSLHERGEDGNPLRRGK